MSTPTPEERLNFYLLGIDVILCGKPELLEKECCKDLWDSIHINRLEMVAAIVAFGESERRAAALDIKHRIDTVGADHSSVRKPLKKYIHQTYLCPNV